MTVHRTDLATEGDPSRAVHAAGRPAGRKPAPVPPAETGAARADRGTAGAGSDAAPLSIGAMPASDALPAAPSTTATDANLPYGPFLRRTLPAIQRMFRVLNRFYVLPAIRAGLGPLHANPVTGSWMLLRTTGRRTGLRREAALGYAILDGAVYCSAGFGERTAWYRNLLAEPRIEVILPAGGFAAVAETVSDPDELDRGWRALIRALGVLGRVFVCPADAAPAELADRTANLPLVRIRLTGLAAGPADPGGRFWVVPTILGLAWLARRVRRPRGAARCR